MVAYTLEVLASENIWADKLRFANAERQYYESFYKLNKEHSLNSSKNKIVDERKLIQAKNSKIKFSNKNDSDKKPNSKLVLSSAENVDEKSNVKKKKTKKSKTILNSNFTNGGSNIMQNDFSQMNTTKKLKGNTFNNQCTLVSEIAKAREHIKNSLEKMDGIASLAASPVSSEVAERLAAVEKNNEELKKLIEGLKGICLDSQKRILELEAQIKDKKTENIQIPKKEQEDDDGVDLFASDSEDENDDAIRIREERLAAYAAKKSKKPALIAKSSLVLDVKPWDDETDLKHMESEIRKIETEGLLWGASKFLPVAFGIQKLAISCVVEDEKVSIDWLTEEIEKLEDFVQSVDVAAFNKI